MFNFGFWELLMVLLVALLVIGPKRLPEVAQTLGRWLALSRNLFSSVKSEFEQEIEQQVEHKSSDEPHP